MLVKVEKHCAGRVIFKLLDITEVFERSSKEPSCVLAILVLCKIGNNSLLSSVANFGLYLCTWHYCNCFANFINLQGRSH